MTVSMVKSLPKKNWLEQSDWAQDYMYLCSNKERSLSRVLHVYVEL